MNAILYRKYYLKENWSTNEFEMIKEKINVPLCFPCPYSVNFQISHPKVLSGEAYWITHNELCIGYQSSVNSNVYRPIFSHERQKKLDIVHYGEEGEEGEKNKGDYIHNNPNLKYARKKYIVGLDNAKKLPMDCIEVILSFIIYRHPTKAVIKII